MFLSGELNYKSGFPLEQAIVLITLQASMEYEALNALKKVVGVREAHFLYGPYDAYAMIEAESVHQIQDIVMKNIREIKGIKSTITCFFAD
jgi:DNA-binding Lrp family transcriptional regulator